MTKKKIRPNPEPEAPADVPAIRRIPLRAPPAFGDTMDARQFRDLAAGLKSLEDAGFIRAPSTAPAVVHAPQASRGIEGAVDELEKYINGFARAQALAVRLNPGGGLMGAIKEIADTKMGEQIGTVVGEMASGFVKSKVRDGELTKEIQLQAMKLETAKIEHGLTVGSSAVVGPPAHHPAPAQAHGSGSPTHLAPAAVDLINAHAAKMDAATEKMDRIEKLLLSMKAPAGAPSPAEPRNHKKKVEEVKRKPGRPPKAKAAEPAGEKP